MSDQPLTRDRSPYLDRPPDPSDSESPLLDPGCQSLTSCHAAMPIRRTINSGVGCSSAFSSTMPMQSERPRYRYTFPSQRAARQPRRKGSLSVRSRE